MSTEADADVLRVYDGTGTGTASLGVHSGSVLPADVTSSANNMYLTFLSNDNTVRDTGFEVVFEATGIETNIWQCIL